MITRKSNPWKFIVPVLIVLAIVGAVMLVRKQQAAKNKPIIRTAVIKRGTVTASVSGNGVLQPWTTVEVKSNVGGQVMELAVDEGDAVHTGQLIARIDPADSQTNLEQSQADLAGTTSKVQQARQALDMQRRQDTAQLENARQTVITAQVRVLQAEKQAILQQSLSGASIQQAEQELATAKIRLSQAQAQFTLQQKLTSASIQSAQQSLESARARQAQAEAQANIQPALTDAAIKEAQSGLASAKAALTQTTTSLTSQKIAAAASAYDQAKANDTFAQNYLTRQQQLFAKGYVAKSAVEAAQQSCDVAKAQLDSAGNKRDTVRAEADDDIRVAQARVEQAQATLNTAEANRLQDSLKQQDVVAARAAVKQAEAQLATAQANGDQDSLKQQDIEASRAAIKQAEAQVATARANQGQDVVKQQDVDASQAALKQARAALAVAQANLLQEQMKQADIVQANAQQTRSQATLKNAQTQLGYTTIIAPRGGIVTAKYVEPGSIVTAGRSLTGTGAGVTIVDIADTSRMFAQVNVDETDIAQIRVGQPVDVSVDAYPDDKFTGVVTKIAPQAVVVQNVTYLPVTVEIAHPDARLKPQMNASCDFIVTRKTNVLLAPNEAVEEQSDGTVVKVLGDKGIVRRPVKLGLMGNDVTEVISGLREGDKVVTAEIKPTTTSGQPVNGPGGSGGGSRGGGPMMGH